MRPCSIQNSKVLCFKPRDFHVVSIIHKAYEGKCSVWTANERNTVKKYILKPISASSNEGFIPVSFLQLMLFVT